MSQIKFTNSLVSSAVKVTTRLRTIENINNIKMNDINNKHHNSNLNTINNNKIFNSYLFNSIINIVPYRKHKKCVSLFKMSPDVHLKHQKEKLYNNKLRINTNHNYSKKTLGIKDIDSLPDILEKRQIFLSEDNKKNKYNTREKSFFEEAAYNLQRIAKPLKIKNGDETESRNLYKNEYPGIVFHSKKNLEYINEDEDKVQQVMNYKETKNSYDFSDEDIEEIKKSFKKYAKKNEDMKTINLNLIKKRNFRVNLPKLYMFGNIKNKKCIKRSIPNSEKKIKTKIVLKEEE